MLNASIKKAKLEIADLSADVSNVVQINTALGES